ncbi:zinc finger protein 391 [Eurosta solidaginis]|uniref:zinc finger protein 391 n=1 Tax=Eurosta solidaginis TaxID=178769 RepID=UPI0035306329
MKTMLTFQVCRCCLREDSTCTYGIFDGSPIGGGSDEDLRTALLSCAPNLQLKRNDGLTDVICESCLLCVRDSLSFRRRCEESERELQRRYADTERAIEEALHLVNLIDARGEQATRDTEHVNGLQQVSELGPTELALLDDLLQLEEVNLEHLQQSEVAATHEDGSKNHTNKRLTRKAVKDLRPLHSKTASNDLQTPAHTNIQQQQNDSPQSPRLNYDSSDSNSESVSTTRTKRRKKAHSGTPKSLHPCPECEKKFTRNFQLKLHMISVHKLGDGLYECNECHKTFASRHSLTYHQRSVHSDERPFACSHCDRRFVLRTQLSSHMRIHTGEAKPRIFECLECGKRWPTKSDLRTHMRSHVTAQERPFKCDQCDKAFFTRGHLTSHLLVHSGEKPFSCSTCGKSYQCVGNLNNHMARQHEYERGSGRLGRNTSAETSEI